MNNKLKISLLTIAAIALFYSCKKEGRGDHESKSVTLNVTLSAGTVYELDLSKYGDADDLATITTQAENFDVSEIYKSSVNGKYLYKYSVAAIPKTGFKGIDKVILKVSEPTGRPHCTETNITINFTIQ